MLEHIDADPLIAALDNVQGEIRKVDTDAVIDDVVAVVNKTLEHLDKATDELEKAVDEFSEHREAAFDAIEGEGRWQFCKLCPEIIVVSIIIKCAIKNCWE